MSDPSSAIAELASTIQSASINKHPSTLHDLNPSTAASRREPVSISLSRTPSASAAAAAEAPPADDEVPLSALRPVPRPPHQRPGLPPLPDLRFEQSYLRSIAGADSHAAVAWVTLRDQVLLPLAQGALWTLAVAGWRHWNRASAVKGAGVGARVRRWWWGVNGWALPGEERRAAAPRRT